MYKKVTTLLGNEFVVEFDIDSPELWIPEDLSNADYQRYLASLEA
jgi:hypothetical protein